MLLTFRETLPRLISGTYKPQIFTQVRKRSEIRIIISIRSDGGRQEKRDGLGFQTGSLLHPSTSFYFEHHKHDKVRRHHRHAARQAHHSPEQAVGFRERHHEEHSPCGQHENGQQSTHCSPSAAGRRCCLEADQ